MFLWERGVLGRMSSRSVCREPAVSPSPASVIGPDSTSHTHTHKDSKDLGEKRGSEK